MIDQLPAFIGMPAAIAAWIGIAIIVIQEVHRERASSSAEVDEPQREAQEGARRYLASTMHRRVRADGGEGRLVAGGSPDSGRARWSALDREHWPSAYQLQSEERRQARRASDELAASSSARYPRLVK